VKRLGVLVVAGVLLAAAGCGDDDAADSSSPTTAAPAAGSDSGSATSTSEQRPESSAVTSADELKIAYFVAGEATSYLALSIETAQATAEEAGASLDVIPANFDPQAQLNQIETAMASGDYNAFLVMALDPSLLCDVLTEQAPAQGIMVSLVNQPICDNAQNEGEAVWAPGTVNTVVTQSRSTYFDWVGQVAEEHADGAEVAALLGVSNLTPINVSFIDALEDAQANDENFNVVSIVNTDYSAAQGAAAAETLMQANPDLSVIMSGYSPMTRAVVDAVNAAGKADQIQVYDLGGDEWALGAVTAGDIAGTVYLDPISEARLAVQGLIDIANNDDTPKYIDLSRAEDLPDSSAIVTPDNVDAFVAQY